VLCQVLGQNQPSYFYMKEKDVLNIKASMLFSKQAEDAVAVEEWIRAHPSSVLEYQEQVKYLSITGCI